MGMFDAYTDVSNWFNEARNWGNNNWKLGKPTKYWVDQNTSFTFKKISVGNWCYGASGWGVTFRMTF